MCSILLCCSCCFRRCSKVCIIFTVIYFIFTSIPFILLYTFICGGIDKLLVTEQRDNDFSHSLFDINKIQHSKPFINEEIIFSEQFIDTNKNPCLRSNFSQYICGKYPFEWYNGVKIVNVKMGVFIDRVDREIKIPHYLGNVRDSNYNMKLNKLYESCQKYEINGDHMVMQRIVNLISLIDTYSERTQITDLLYELNRQGYQSLLSTSLEIYTNTAELDDNIDIQLKASFPTGYVSYYHERIVDLNVILKQFDKDYNHDYSIGIYNSLLIGYLKSFKHYKRVKLGDLSEMLLHSQINMVDYITNVFDGVLKFNITRNIGIYTNMLSFLHLLDSQLGKMSMREIFNFLKFYCALGEMKRWNGSSKIKLNVVDSCMHIVRTLLPLTYCEYVKEFIGPSLKKSISKVEQLVAFTIQEFKSMIIDGKLNHLFKNLNIKSSLDRINSLYINIGKCYDNHLVRVKLGNLIENYLDMISTENLIQIYPNSKEEFYSNINEIITLNSTIGKSFRIHRKLFFRNHLSNHDTKGLHNMLGDVSPRYNTQSHLIIFPLQMLISPIVRESYSFEEQSAYYSFFIAHELSHVIQRFIHVSNAPPQIEMENQADAIATDVSLSLLKRFGVIIGKTTFKCMFQFWCKKTTLKGNVDNYHLEGGFRIDNAIKSMSSISIREFNRAYECDPNSI